MNEGVSLKLLILGGVDNAGKSTTIRYSTKYLGISLGFVEKFLSQRNPSKRILINSTSSMSIVHLLKRLRERMLRNVGKFSGKGLKEESQTR